MQGADSSTNMMPFFHVKVVTVLSKAYALGIEYMTFLVYQHKK
jgi:hypothetical protein